MHKGKDLRFQIVRNDSLGIAPGASTSVECDLPPAPLITHMLVLAACNARDGPFAGFDLTEQEWYELRAACWLHDCGKVTTPGHIVDTPPGSSASTPGSPGGVQPHDAGPFIDEVDARV